MHLLLSRSSCTKWRWTLLALPRSLSVRRNNVWRSETRKVSPSHLVTYSPLNCAIILQQQLLLYRFYYALLFFAGNLHLFNKGAESTFNNASKPTVFPHVRKSNSQSNLINFKQLSIIRADGADTPSPQHLQPACWLLVHSYELSQPANQALL